MLYTSDKKILHFSYLALQDQFSSEDEFISFFETIKNKDQRNKFLKTTSFYLFLVKKGDWLVDIPGSNKKIDYLTDTYKYIAIFSLIESLQSKRPIDFYSFLERRKSNVTFPIMDKKQLNQWYRKYKQEFGSIQKVTKFFKSLSTQKKADLIKNLEVQNTKPSIENLSKYLYRLRSKFVHKTKLILNMSGTKTVSKHVVCSLSIKKLMSAFEEGLVLFFKQQK